VRYLVKFLQVGALGFAVDAGLLWLLIYQMDMHPVVSRGISFLVTICITFVANARYTFAVSVRDSSMTRYVIVQTIGAVINFASYTWLVLSGPLSQRPLVALIVGSALAAVHNFLMMRRFVFKPSDNPADSVRSAD
jgi:putative flippase GtrA